MAGIRTTSGRLSAAKSMARLRQARLRDARFTRRTRAGRRNANSRVQGKRGGDERGEKKEKKALSMSFCFLFFFLSALQPPTHHHHQPSNCGHSDATRSQDWYHRMGLRGGTLSVTRRALRRKTGCWRKVHSHPPSASSAPCTVISHCARPHLDAIVMGMRYCIGFSRRERFEATGWSWYTPKRTKKRASNRPDQNERSPKFAALKTIITLPLQQDAHYHLFKLL